MQHIAGMVRRCLDDYEMISDGDRIAVGVSGGKDSLVLLCALDLLRRYYPRKFSLCAITIDPGFRQDFSGVEKLCAEKGIPYVIKRTQISQIVFEARQEPNPCSLCSKMRKGALHDAMKELGCNKIALGHHFDDAVDTFVMSLLYEGRLGCFDPVTYMSRMDVTQIRPLLYVGEKRIIAAAEKYSLPVVKNPCPMDGTSRREEIHQLILELSARYPDLRTKIFGAMQRLPLQDWEPKETRRHPLP